MLHKTEIELVCPNCDIHMKVFVEQKFRGLLMICPHCFSNVVFYNQKLGVISDKLLSKLIKNDKLKACGIMNISRENIREAITQDDVIDLKIDLETSKSVDAFLKKI